MNGFTYTIATICVVVITWTACAFYQEGQVGGCLFMGGLFVANYLRFYPYQSSTPTRKADAP